MADVSMKRTTRFSSDYFLFGGGGELISPPPRSTNFLVDSRWRAPFGLRAIQWRVSFLWQFFFSQISSALVVFYIVMVDGPHVIST